MPKLKTLKKPKSRPLLDINWDIVDNLLRQGCNGVEIAARLGCHPDTLYIRCDNEKEMTFSAYAQIKRADGDAMLRTAQFELALEQKDKTMLVWLGKNRLGQKDTPPSIEMNEDLVVKFNLFMESLKTAQTEQRLKDLNARQRDQNQDPD